MSRYLPSIVITLKSLIIERYNWKLENELGILQNIRDSHLVFRQH